MNSENALYYRDFMIIFILKFFKKYFVKILILFNSILLNFRFIELIFSNIETSLNKLIYFKIQSIIFF